MALNKYKCGDPIPDDFWNYDLNIILGYRYRMIRNWEKETNKYAIKPNGDLK